MKGMRLKVKIGENEYDVYVRRLNRTCYRVRLNEKIFDVTIRKPGEILPKRIEIKKERRVEIFEGEPVKAMLPGVITKIIVREGEKVKKGDTLFILEAMKMENEVKSPKDGIVKQITVKEGERVEVGDILAVIM